MTKFDRDLPKLEMRLDAFFDAIDDEDYKLARLIVKKAVRKFPRHPVCFALQGLAAVFIDDDHTDGYLFFKQAINSGYAPAFVYFNFGLCAEKSGSIAESLAAFQNALDSASPEELHQYEPARLHLQAIREQLPEHLTLEQYLIDAEIFEEGVVLLESHKFSEAANCFTLLLKTQPEHVQSCGNLGICQMYLGDHLSAKRAFHRALAIDPDYRLAETNLTLLKALEDGEIEELPGLGITDFYAEKEKTSNPATELNQAISQAVANEQFNSIEDAQAFVENYMNEHNSSPNTDMLNLTPSQTHKLLTEPFESSDLLSWQFSDVTKFTSAPVYWLAVNLIGALGADGVKCTANGNLPRNLCRSLFDSYMKKFAPNLIVSKINKEDDFINLHVVRSILLIAKLIRKHGGRWKPLKSTWQLYERIQQGDNTASTELYQVLFQTYATEYNWAYISGNESDCAFYQFSIGYSLYMLRHLGTEWRHYREYQVLYEQAFPDQADSLSELSKIEFPSQYIFHFWFDFAWQVGLIEKRESTDENTNGFSKEIVATPLFTELISWHI